MTEPVFEGKIKNGVFWAFLVAPFLGAYICRASIYWLTEEVCWCLMFLPAWRCSMSVGDFLSMTSRLECSTQVYLSCIFDLKHLCYHVWSCAESIFSEYFQIVMTSWLYQKFSKTSSRIYPLLGISQLWRHHNCEIPGRLTKSWPRIHGYILPIHESPGRTFVEDVVPVRCTS